MILLTNQGAGAIQKIGSEKINLRLAGEVDRHRIYEWLAASDVTCSMMGPPDYEDHPVPTWEEFNRDYKHYYFDGSRPEKGQCFIIVAGGEDVGVISYSQVDPESNEVELDIWLRSEADCGKGYGSQAIEQLCDHLRYQEGVVQFIIRPSARNKRAVAAYRKAGLETVKMSMKEQEQRYGPADYKDSVVMIRVMDE